MKKSDYVNALIEYADFINRTPFPDEWQGMYGMDSWPTPSLALFVQSKKDFGLFCSLLGGLKKGTDGTYLEANKHFGKGFFLQVNVRKDLTCEKVKVGTKTIPAQEAKLIEATPEHEEDVFEWKCPESFISLKEEVATNGVR